MQTFAQWWNAHARLNTLAVLFAASALVYNFPVLIHWLPIEAQKSVETVAGIVIQNLVGVALFWVKDRTVVGNGTLANPTEKSS